MSFLLPAAAWLAALAGPIIALYLLKSRRRRRAVPSLLFWNQLAPKLENQPLWRHLRRWFSLLLQLLILGLLVLALMRPAFEWEQGDAARVIVVADPSASMGATDRPGSRLIRARDNLSRMISRLRASDQMAVLTAGSPPRILSGWERNRRSLDEAARQLDLLPTGTSPDEAFALAENLAASAGGARIVILSDAVWPDDASAPKEASIHGALAHGAATPPNTGLTLFAVRRSPVSPGDWQLDAEIASNTAADVTLELTRDGEPIDRVTFRSDPAAPYRKSWSGNSREGAGFEGILRLTDSLPSDNAARVTLSPLVPVSVELRGPRNAYLEAALDAIPAVAWFQGTDGPISSGVDLLICSGNAVPEGARGARACLLINPANTGFWGERGEPTAAPPISLVADDFLPLQHTGLRQISVESIPRWKPAPGSDIFAAAGDLPVLFGRWDSAPRWLVVGFDPAESDFPLRTAFPVLLANLIQSLREEGSMGQSAILPGLVESRLTPLAPARETGSPMPAGSALPGWWLAAAGALAFLLFEAWAYHRRLTE